MEESCAEEMGRFLDNSIFRQVTELHVAERLPWANHCDICAKALHARDVVAEPENGSKVTFPGNCHSDSFFFILIIFQ